MIPPPKCKVLYDSKPKIPLAFSHCFAKQSSN